MNYLELKFKKRGAGRKLYWSLIDLNEVQSIKSRPVAKTVTRIYVEKDSCLSIPAEIDGIPVSAIEGNLQLPDEISELIIPDSVKHIVHSAFLRERIKKLHIGKELNTTTFIFRLDELRSVTLSELNPNYEMIDGSLYRKDINTLIWTESGVIKDGTELIAIKAFRGLILDEVIIPDSVRQIGQYGFYQCSIRRLSICGSISNSVMLSFDECNFEEVEFRKNSTTPLNLSIPEHCFSDCSIQKLSIADGMVQVYSKAFLDCEIFELNIHGGLFVHDSFMDKNTFKNLRVITINIPKANDRPITGIEELDKLIKSSPMPLVSQKVNDEWCETLYW